MGWVLCRFWRCRLYLREGSEVGCGRPLVWWCWGVVMFAAYDCRPLLASVTMQGVLGSYVVAKCMFMGLCNMSWRHSLSPPGSDRQ